MSVNPVTVDDAEIQGVVGNREAPRADHEDVVDATARLPREVWPPQHVGEQADGAESEENAALDVEDSRPPRHGVLKVPCTIGDVINLRGRAEQWCAGVVTQNLLCTRNRQLHIVQRATSTDAPTIRPYPYLVSLLRTGKDVYS